MRYIAEICSNHNGNLSRAIELIKVASEVGCHAVKFQLFRLDKTFSNEVLTHPDYQFVRDREAWELPLEWLPQLKDACLSFKMEFGCTPFYIEAIDELKPFVDFYKIASYSLLDYKLINAVSWMKKPLVVSTGMATNEEIKWSLFPLLTSDLTVLHCVSEYPARNYQLDRFKFIQRMFAHIGYSDHTVDPAAMYYFYHWGARTFEFHLDLDGGGYEYGIGHCWLPKQIKPVIETINRMESIDASGQSDAEDVERGWRADPSDGLRPMLEIRKTLR